MPAVVKSTPGVLAESADPRLLGHPDLLLTGALGKVGGRKDADDLELVLVDLDGGRSFEPALGYAAGEPCGDESLLFRAEGRGATGAAPATPSTGPWSFVICVRWCHSYKIT